MQRLIMLVYRCRKCGNIENKIDTNFICPLCGSNYSNFEEIEKEEVLDDKKVFIANDNLAIARIKEKCINCGICKNICKNKVGIKYSDNRLDNPACINCGMCIINCPVGAMIPKYNYNRVKEEINNKKVVVALISPAVRVSLGEEFGMEAGSNVIGKIITALKQLGFSYIFDTSFGADLTVMEESYELLDRIKKNKNLPQFTSCCPSWVKYCEVYHPELINNLSTCKSPISMLNTVIKKYFSKEKNIDEKDIITVAITPCTSKKAEIKRKEIKDGDYVITTSELAIYLKEENIDFINLEDGNFDHIFSKGSGAGVIFGNTGGVSEAIVRNIYYILTKTKPSDKLLNFSSVRGLDNVKEASVNINGTIINIAVIHGLTNLEEILKVKDKYDFIEVMNCTYGCVGGGGGPLVAINKLEEKLKKRIEGLYNCDKINSIRCSYENSDIKLIYDKFLGKPLSDTSINLLHTVYQDKSNILNLEELEKWN